MEKIQLLTYGIMLAGAIAGLFAANWLSPVKVASVLVAALYLSFLHTSTTTTVWVTQKMGAYGVSSTFVDVGFNALVCFAVGASLMFVYTSVRSLLSGGGGPRPRF